MMFDGLADVAMLFVCRGNGVVGHAPPGIVTAADADAAARALRAARLHLQDQP
jgi:hypothetical protein